MGPLPQKAKISEMIFKETLPPAKSNPGGEGINEKLRILYRKEIIKKAQWGKVPKDN